MGLVAVRVTPDEERWAEELQIERMHGDRAPLWITERIGALALAGDVAGVQRLGRSRRGSSSCWLGRTHLRRSNGTLVHGPRSRKSLRMKDIEPPRVTIAEYSADQLAMLGLLGGDPATAERGVVPFYNSDDRTIEEWPCPVAIWRRRQRMVLPTGNVTGYHPD